ERLVVREVAQHLPRLDVVARADLQLLDLEAAVASRPGGAVGRLVVVVPVARGAGDDLPDRPALPGALDLVRRPPAAGELGPLGLEGSVEPAALLLQFKQRGGRHDFGGPG